jgi:hypothetical protein
LQDICVSFHYKMYYPIAKLNSLVNRTLRGKMKLIFSQLALSFVT